MSKRQRLIWLASLISGVAFLLGFLWSFQLPKVRSWARLKVIEISDKHLPVKILPTSVDVRLIPLQATFNNVKIIPKADTRRYIKPLEISAVTVELSLLQLAQGRLHIRTLKVQGATAEVSVPKPRKSKNPPLEGLFNALSQVPLSRLKLENIGINLEVQSPRLKADIRNLALTAESLRHGLALDVSAGATRLKDRESNAEVRVGFQARTYLEPKAVTVTEFKLKHGDSFAVASGKLQGDTEKLKFNSISLETRTSLQLESTRNWLARMFPQLRQMPILRGHANVEAKIHSDGAGQPELDFTARTTGFSLDNFYMDRVTVNGEFKKGRFHLPLVTFRNPGASFTFKETEVLVPRLLPTSQHGPVRPVTIRSKAEIVAAELHQFLKSLGLKDVPVYLGLKGKLPCHGTLAPVFQLDCHGEVTGSNLIVNENNAIKNSIVAIPAFTATGKVTINQNAVGYSAEIAMPNSKGRSSGTIDYVQGFKIDYEADSLNFKDATNLANLKIEGTAKLKGTTEGDSHSATLGIKLYGSDLWLDDYWLGFAKTDISYKRGTLAFTNIRSHYTTSRYSGNVAIELREKTIHARARVPFFDSRDLLKAFSRRARLPVKVTGTGKADIEVWGPLEFTKLSYNLNSTLFRGTIARESFDQAHFDVRAKDGHVDIERGLLVKDKSTIKISGSGYPDGNIKTAIQGRGIRLENSSNVAGLGLNLSGQVDFDMDLSGYVLKPLTDLRGTIIKTAIGDQGVPDSNFRLRFREHTIEGGGQFLGEVVKTEFVLPLDSQAPFRLALRTNEWNFAPLFAAAAGPGSRKDYEGALTSDIKLASPNGGFWNSSGTISVNKFFLRRGALHMKAPEALRLTFDQGRLLVRNFSLEGDGTFLKINESSNPVSKIDLQIKGKLDLNLVALALPFFEELRGLTSFAFNVHAGPKLAEVLGSAYIDKGYLKIFGFPHAFEDIHGDFLFSQKKVLVNSLKGDLAGGRLSADGTVELLGYKNYPVQVAAVLEKANLNIPSGVKTVGSGRLFFTGNWFPFQMQGVYDVHSGMITREFDDEETSAQGVQRSTFLPRMLLQEGFSPLEIDLVVDSPSPIDIKNSMIEGKLFGKLTIKGPTDHLGVLGQINASKDSKVTFRDNTFDLTTGVVNFTDPTDLNPSLYATARSRVDNYDINLILQGTARKPDVNLSSSPPLSEQDIFSLLALGIPGQKIEEVGSKAQAATTGVTLGGILTKNPATATLKEKTGIEVGLSTGFDGTNNVAVPKITASRRFTPRLGVTASRSIGNEPTTEAKLRYQLSNRTSIVGSWEAQDRQETIDSTSTDKDKQEKFGVDFEYKFEFK